MNWDGDLFDRFSRLQREMEEAFGTNRGPASIRAVARGSYPAINVGSTEDGIEVFVFAAGLDRDAIDLSVEQSLLTVSGECPAQEEPDGEKTYLRERFSGRFSRSVSLPEDVEPDSAQASYRNGVLHVRFRRKAEARPRKIQVNQ
jgi:HSP20 family protein